MTDRGETVPIWRILRSAVRLVWASSRRDLLVIFATQVISAAALVAQLYLAKRVLDEVTVEGGIDEFGTVAPILGLLLVVRIVVSVTQSAQGETELVVHERVHRAAALEMYDVAVAADLGQYDDSTFHDRLTRAQANIDYQIWASVWSLIALTSALVTLGAIAAVLIALAPFVLLLAAVGALPLWWVRRRNNEAMYRLEYEYTAEDRERYYLEELLVARDAAGEIRSYDLGSRLLSEIDRLFGRRIDRTRRLARQRLVWTTGATIVSNVIAVGSVAVLVGLIVDGTMSVAEGGVAILALQQAALRLAAVSESVGALGGAALFLRDYETFVRTLPPVDDLAAPISRDDLDAVRFERVTFTYPGASTPAVRDIELEIRRGELVALVGENGSGKSTLAKLVGGLYSIDSGQIVWDTRQGPITDRRRIRRTVGLVFQNFLRFELSVRDNVAFGDVSGEPDDQRIWSALERAGIAGIVRATDRGLDARLGRLFADGTEMSAGQWQRVGIARAFYRDAPLLVLDEPTAAVDAKAERALFDAVARLQEGRGVLLITHRLATVKDADRIYVLDGGRIIESGTHHELMAHAGAYRSLYELQATAYREG